MSFGWLAQLFIGTFALVQHCSSAISKIEIPIEIFYSDLSGNCFLSQIRQHTAAWHSPLHFSTFLLYGKVFLCVCMVRGVLPFRVHRFWCEMVVV